MTDQLLEAHAPESFYERVAALEPGEVARLQGGVAVKHLALEDARLAWQVGRPSNWRRGEVDFEGDSYRTVEEAVRAAFRKSAESTDPESIGGTTRLTRWAPLEDGGAEVRIQDFTLTGQVIVSAPNQPGATRTVQAGSLIRKNPVLAGLEEAVGQRTRDDMDADGIPYEKGKKGSGKLPTFAKVELSDYDKKIKGTTQTLESRAARVNGRTVEIRKVKHYARVMSGRTQVGLRAEFTEWQLYLDGRRVPGFQEFGVKAAKEKAALRAQQLQEEVGKPGTNWKQVKGEDRKRINPIVRHYGKMAHGFTQCVADNTKRFGKEGAERVCAVVKDMGKKTTHWRKGGKVKEEEVDYWTGRLLEAAGGDVDGLEAMMLAYILEAERATEGER